MLTVLSDTHGNYQSWKNIYKQYMQSSSCIIHCGDIFYGGDNNSAHQIKKDILFLDNKFNISKGNCDELNELSFIKNAHSDFGLIDYKGIKIIFTHGNNYSSTMSKYYLAKENNADIVFSGHTHIANISNYKDIILANPGSHNNPRTEDKIKTCIVIKDNTINIMDIASKNSIFSLALKEKI